VNVSTEDGNPFDLFIIDSQEDYECYIRATVMLDQRMAVECPFLKDPKKALFNITYFNSIDDSTTFVNPLNKYKEFFFIIDNTDFPLFPISDQHPVPLPPRNDVIVNVSFVSRYQVTEEYTLYIFVGAVVAVFLGLILIVMIVLYCKNAKKYHKIAEERRQERRAS
jgi:hypothetical protein